MPLKLPNFFKSRSYLNNIDSYQISAPDLTSAQPALASDVDSFFLNGLISFGSSVSALRKNNFSWAFIQSYYSIFFLAKAFTGINGFSIVYHNNKAFGIKLQVAEKFERFKGNSHEVVFNQFKKYFASDILLASTIDGDNPIDWFNKTRNSINYTTNPLPDPAPPISLYSYDKDLRSWIAKYLSDEAHLYTFDPCHCYISFPIRLFNKIYEHYENNNMSNSLITEDVLNHLKDNLADNRGPIAPLIARLKGISSDQRI